MKTITPPVEFRDMSEYKERMKSLLTIDPRRTAALTVDMQREYLDMAVAGSPASPEEAERVLKHSKDLLDFCRAEGIRVVHVNVNLRPEEADRSTAAGPYGTLGRKNALSQNAQAPVSPLPARLVGSPSAQVPASLVAPTDIHVLSKKVMDSFYSTELEPMLRRMLEIDTLLLMGVNTDTCVYATTFGASIRGFRPIVVSDCVASTRGKDHHWMALELMSRSIAWVMTVEEVKDKVRAAKTR